MAGTFTAQIADFEKKTLQNLRYIAAESIQDVMEAAQTPQPSVKKTGGSFEIGKIPQDVGDLIKSLVSSLNGGAGQAGQTSYVAIIAGLEIGDVMTFEWVSDHAAPMEFGFTTKNGTQVPGRHFVGANAAKFQDFVSRHAAEVQ